MRNINTKTYLTIAEAGKIWNDLSSDLPARIRRWMSESFFSPEIYASPHTRKPCLLSESDVVLAAALMMILGVGVTYEELRTRTTWIFEGPTGGKMGMERGEQVYLEYHEFELWILVYPNQKLAAAKRRHIVHFAHFARTNAVIREVQKENPVRPFTLIDVKGVHDAMLERRKKLS